MYCIARGCISGYIIELPAVFSTWHVIDRNIHMLVRTGTVISVNKVYIWFAYGCLANSLAYHCSLGFITERL
jgi:nitrogen fixation protein FixH